MTSSWPLDEPPHVLGDWGKVPRSSVWYRWIAAEPGGWFTFDLTSGTTFDSLLAVYTGDRLDRLIPVAGNDNYGSRQSSRVSFQALAGTNYSVVVDKKQGYVWVSEHQIDKIARFDPRTEEWVEFPLAEAESDPRRIDIDPTNPNRIFFSGNIPGRVGFVEVLPQ